MKFWSLISHFKIILTERFFEGYHGARQPRVITKTPSPRQVLIIFLKLSVFFQSYQRPGKLDVPYCLLCSPPPVPPFSIFDELKVELTH